jgi:UDP-glucose 4-epimerase
MRIFLTGASGYIGLHILHELLTAEHEVTALVRSPAKLGPFLQAPKLRVFTADLAQGDRISEALQGHDACVHAALLWGEPGTELELPDTIAAANLFDTAGRVGVLRCIFISSVAVHRPFKAEMVEEEQLSSTDYYGATKAAGELFLRAACAEHHMTGIVIRPGPVVGLPAFANGSFRSDRRLSGMVAAAMEARPIEVVANEGRQFCDVVTIAKVVGLLTSLENPHTAYICVDRAIMTWEWIARTVVACVGSQSEVRILPRLINGQVPAFCTDRLEHLVGGVPDARGALIEHIRYLMQLQVGGQIGRR